MKEEVVPKLHTSRPRLLVVCIGLIMLVAIVLVSMLLRPTRSAASYCKVYRQENTRLANSKGDTYSVAVFGHRSSDPHDFVTAFDNLDKVAPKDIEGDVATLRSIFITIEKDPSKGLSASLSGIPAETNVSNWTKSHCGI